MRKISRKTKQRFPTYQVAGTLLVVATLGFTAAYFGQRSQDMAQQQEENLQQAKNEEKEETKDVSTVVEPVVENKTDTVEPIEPIESIPELTLNTPQEEEIVQETVSELSFSGKIQWPLEGKVIMPYSMDKAVYFVTLQQYQYNPAMIIQGNVNDPVCSVGSGKIKSIETTAKTGCTVTVDLGDGYEVIYGQLKEVPLEVGDTVKAGDTIGYVSEPTKYYSMEGSNLYFQMKHQGESVNPMEYLEDEE